MEFTKYTRSNKIVRSVTFEMSPIGNTRAAIKEHGVIEEDAVRKSNAVLIKEVSDNFIREFLNDDKLEKYDWVEWEDLCLLIDDKPAFDAKAEKMKESIAASLSKSFDSYINRFMAANGKANGKYSWKSAGYIDEVIPMYILCHPDYQDEKYILAAESLKHASSAMFKKYFVSYERILNGTNAGSIAYRVMENVLIFCTNSKMYKKFAAKISGADLFAKIADITVLEDLISQNGIDFYNEMIGDLYDKDGQLIRKGFNSRINEYNSTHPDDKIPYLKKMKKQILSYVEPFFTIDKIESKEDLDNILTSVRATEESLTENLKTLFSNLLSNDKFSLDRILLTSAARSTIANSLAGRWDYFENVIREKETDKLKADYFEKKNRILTKLTKKDQKKINDAVTSNISSIADLNHMLHNVSEETVENFLMKSLNKQISLKESSYSVLNNCGFMKSDSKPAWDDNQKIQDYLDHVIAISRMLKYFYTDLMNEKVDPIFVEELQMLDGSKDKIVKSYNMIQNYCTTKTELTAKEKRIQLCFGRPVHFEQTWNNKQDGKFGNLDAALLEFDGLYYYIVPAAKNKRKLNFPVTDIPQEGVNYHYLSTKKNIKLSMALPKMTFKSPAAVKKYAETEEPFTINIGNSTMTVSKKMYDDYNLKTFSSSPDARIALIDYAKEFISKEFSFKCYDYSSLKPSEEYRSYGEFCNEVDSITFSTTSKYVNKDLVDNAVMDGDLYMFLITSADMYKDREKNKDITAIRFNTIMQSMFTGDTSIIINNSPIIYHRPQIIEAVDKHPVGSILVNKMTTDGRTIPGEIYLELCDFYNGKKDHLSAEAKVYNENVSVKESSFPHIKDAHYTREMFTISLSYTLNKGVSNEKLGYALNDEIRRDIVKEGCNVMSIIRGINNLLYYCIVDQNGNQLKAGSLNIVGGVDYYEKLTLLSTQRYIDSKNWKYEKKSAELKDTYLGQVCREIAKIAIANNAIIVIDKLIDSIKNKAAAFDNQVYKKFENRLISTLGNYYDVTLPDNEPGGSSNPLQLTTPDNTSIQNGIIFFIIDSGTKNICQETGYVNLLNTYNINTVTAKTKFLSKISKIYFDADLNEFVFEFSWKDIGSINLKEDEEIPLYLGMNKVWKVRTHITRYKKNKEKRSYEEIDGTEIMKAVMKNYPDMIGKDIDITKLSSKDIQAVYEVFTYYANGFIPRMGNEDSEFISPVSTWTSIGNVPYDEMSAYQLAKKSLLGINKIQFTEDSGRYQYTPVSKVEWYNSLL